MLIVIGRTLQHDRIQIMPLAKASQLVTTLETIQQHHRVESTRPTKFDEKLARRGILRYCVRHGLPLVDGQVDKLMHAFDGIAGLARASTTSEGTARLCHILGEEDGQRVVSFFLDGPAPL